MIKEFSYPHRNGIDDCDRKIFVTREDENYIEGIDLDIVGKDAANIICRRYKKFVPTTESAKELINKFDKEWMRGYRKFSKARVNCWFA